jgi:hypothetical protein
MPGAFHFITTQISVSSVGFTIQRVYGSGVVYHGVSDAEATVMRSHGSLDGLGLSVARRILLRGAL